MTRFLSDFRYSMSKPINVSAISILGLFSVVWGLWLSSPFWNVFTRSSVYSYMDFLPEWLWGAAAIAVGLAILYGAFSKSFNSLVMGAGAGFLLWFILAIMYFVGDWQNTNGITAMAFAVYSAFIYLNLKVNRKSIEGG